MTQLVCHSLHSLAFHSSNITLAAPRKEPELAVPQLTSPRLAYFFISPDFFPVHPLLSSV
jgi:hypothetical protein